MRKIELYAWRAVVRAAVLLLFSLNKLCLWAQYDDKDLPDASSRRDDAISLLDPDGMMDNHYVSFGTSDIIMVVLLIIACYVFRKIWKGCTYLILAAAALMYYILRV